MKKDLRSNFEKFGLTIVLALLVGFFLSNYYDYFFSPENLNLFYVNNIIGYVYNIYGLVIALVFFVVSLVPSVHWKYKRIVTHLALFYIVTYVFGVLLMLFKLFTSDSALFTNGLF
mgnify:CR=1 FL=1